MIAGGDSGLLLAACRTCVRQYMAGGSSRCGSSRMSDSASRCICLECVTSGVENAHVFPVADVLTTATGTGAGRDVCLHGNRLLTSCC